MGMERERPQNGSLANGQPRRLDDLLVLLHRRHVDLWPDSAVQRARCCIRGMLVCVYERRVRKLR